MPTKITCDRDLCKHNDEGECAAEIIIINEEGECLDFEDYRK